jgi:dienelactone hydrolase
MWMRRSSNASAGVSPAGAERAFAWACGAAALLVGLTLSPATAEPRVKFNAAKAQESQPAAPIQGYLTRPAGGGPFPAVVLLHSCLGLPANKTSIGEMFAGWGYVALFVDDFTTRGLSETCAADFGDGAADAFGALAYLSRLPYVDAKRIAVIGYSQGGDAALQIASVRSPAAFKAAAAFYPPCENQAGAKLKIPTLILIGEADDVTPAADCERLARDQRHVKLVVYPGAYHLFDDPALAAGKRLFGMRLQYDAGAAERSRSELRDFLGAKLAR